MGETRPPAPVPFFSCLISREEQSAIVEAAGEPASSPPLVLVGGSHARCSRGRKRSWADAPNELLQSQSQSKLRVRRRLRESGLEDDLDSRSER